MLPRMTTHSQVPLQLTNGDPRTMLDVPGAARRAGVSIRTIRRALARRQLGHYRVGRRVIIPVTEHQAWLERHFRPVLSVIEGERGIEVSEATPSGMTPVDAE